MTAGALEFPFPDPPKPLEPIQVSPGVLWVRLALPFRLDHVNVYLIEEDGGYALIDAGIDNSASKAQWEALFAGPLAGSRITRVVATHCHPDHLGLAGWLCQRFDAPLYASQSEYLDALCLRLDPGALNNEPYRSFYLNHGLGEEVTAVVLNRGLEYLRMVSPVPRTFRRMIAGETLKLGGHGFEVLTGGGHSSEQVMLFSAERNLVFCADQVLAKISPNISVEAIDPDGDPLGIYLRSLDQLRRVLPADVLALPGHNLPFRGVGVRIQQLEAHHAARCKAILEACATGPRSAYELIPVVFGRTLEDPHQVSFAFGEALAHANYLVRREKLRTVKQGGATKFALQGV